MTVNRKPTGRASSIPAGLGWGTAVSMAMTFLGAAAVAKLIDGGMMDWSKCGYGVLGILLLSAWMGALVAAGKIRRMRLSVCMAMGGIYFCCLMLITALFFGGQYSGVGETALLIFCGSMLGVLTGYPGKTRRNRLKREARSC